MAGDATPSYRVAAPPPFKISLGTLSAALHCMKTVLSSGRAEELYMDERELDANIQLMEKAMGAAMLTFTPGGG